MVCVSQADGAGTALTGFDGYSAALEQAGIAAPTLFVDLDVLDANLTAIADAVPAGKAVRVVAKSLPVPQLLLRALHRVGSDRLMTFSVAMLRQLEQALPGREHLFGKPVPVRAVANLVASGPGERELVSRVTWLVDTSQRIDQYARLASEHALELRVALELDVGLHRGGCAPGDVRSALQQIADSPGLRFNGLMGYEPHLPVLPIQMGVRGRAQQKFYDDYRAAVATAESVFGTDEVKASILNTAGSKTLAQRAHESPFNDLSVGSLMLKPLDFDAVVAPQTRPAMYIATPVLKTVDPLAIPGFGANRVAQLALGGGAKRGVYIHGGHWLAQPAHPAGLNYSKVIGRSSNQELLVTAGELGVGVDDFVFLRPTQSEAVMLQFGPIAVLSGGAVVDFWEPFAPTA